MKLTAKNRLRKWIADEKYDGRQYLKTSEIIRYGVDHYSNRSLRNCQDFASKGELIKRISRAEAILNNFSGNEGVYKIL